VVVWMEQHLSLYTSIEEVCKQPLRWMGRCVIHHRLVAPPPPPPPSTLFFREFFSLFYPSSQAVSSSIMLQPPLQQTFTLMGEGDCSNSYFVRFLPPPPHFSIFFCFYFPSVMKGTMKVFWRSAKYSLILQHCIISKCQR
jgi:hypothetical protein